MGSEGIEFSDSLRKEGGIGLWGEEERMDSVSIPDSNGQQACHQLHRKGGEKRKGVRGGGRKERGRRRGVGGMDGGNRGKELRKIKAHVVIVCESNRGTDCFFSRGVEGRGVRRRERRGRGGRGRCGEVNWERGEEEDIGSVGPRNSFDSCEGRK